MKVLSLLGHKELGLVWERNTSTVERRGLSFQTTPKEVLLCILPLEYSLISCYSWPTWFWRCWGRILSAWSWFCRQHYCPCFYDFHDQDERLMQFQEIIMNNIKDKIKLSYPVSKLITMRWSIYIFYVPIWSLSSLVSAQNILLSAKVWQVL